MKTKPELKIVTIGKFDFNQLPAEEKNILYTSLLTSILEIYTEKTNKRRKK